MPTAMQLDPSCQEYALNKSVKLVNLFVTGLTHCAYAGVCSKSDSIHMAVILLASLTPLR